MQATIGNYTLSIKGELPAPKRPVLLCVGSGPDALEQAAAFRAHTPCDVAACNEAIALYPGKLALAATLHEDMLAGWVNNRPNQSARPCTVANDPAEGVDVVVAMDRACGSSGMYLALLGRLMGYPRIVLAGIKIEREGEDAYRAIWRAAKAKGALEGAESLTPGWLCQLLKGAA
jgi:hypothetical protein